MSIEIHMPALSPTMTEGTLSKWLVKEGDEVKPGDVLAEVETDKATMEIEAVDGGIVSELLVKEGSSGLPINSIIAILNEKKDKLISEKEKSTSQKKEKKQTKNSITIENKKNNLKLTEHKVQNNKKNDSYSEKNIKASPYVKKISLDKKIDLSRISGSGPSGRIIKRDLETKEFSRIQAFSTDQNFQIPSTIRKIIADRTTKTKQNVPHFYLTIESNVDKLLELRNKISSTCNSKISINDILVKALALAQQQNPLTNVSWVNDKILKGNSVDVSIAVALEEGLITPIIKNADKKGILEISNEIKYLVKKAQNGKLLPNEYTGGSISISNLGMFGITEFSAIINPPQSSILAVGKIQKVAGVVEDEIKIINTLKSTLSVDHRVLDGAVAGKLLKNFSDILENPFNIWLDSKDMEII